MKLTPASIYPFRGRLAFERLKTENEKREGEKMKVPASLVTEVTAIPVLHPDLLNNVLRQLDGTDLASISCAATEFHNIAGDQSLWQRLVTTSWPSISGSDVIQSLIAFFPGGFQSFYADAYPLVSPSSPLTPPVVQDNLPGPSDLVSFVDIWFGKKLRLSKVIHGIGMPKSGDLWFQDSPFRLEALERKDDSSLIAVADGDRTGEEVCRLLADEFRMSWIVLDTTRGKAVNLTCRTPLEVERRWYSETESVINFGMILPRCEETIYCGVSVKCGGCEGGALKLREVGLTMEDKGGNILLGRDILDVLWNAMGARRRIGGVWLSEKYAEFVRAKREIKESKARREKRVDMACVLFGVTLFAALVALMITPRS